jgi:hypothetical protein
MAAAGAAAATQDKRAPAAAKDTAPAAKGKAPEARKPLQQPGQSVLDAARRLGKIARYLANANQLSAFDTLSLPEGPAWDMSKKMPPSLQSACSVVYREAQKPGSKAPADYELPGLYRQDFELVVPMMFERAKRTFPDQILAMSTGLVPLATALTASGVAERLYANAVKTARSLHGRSEQRWGERRVWVPNGEAVSVPRWDSEWARYELEIRRILAPRVAECADPVLSVLFAHHAGVFVIKKFVFSGPRAGFEMALGLLNEASEALSDLFIVLRDDPKKVWRFPGLIWAAARAEGLGSVPGLRLFLTAICKAKAKAEAGPLGPLLTFTSVALGILAMVFAPPAGVGALSFALGAGSFAAQAAEFGQVYFEDAEQVAAAKATGFQVEEARLGSLDVSRTALGGAMLLLSAIAFYFSLRGLLAGEGLGSAPKEPAPPAPKWTSPHDEAAATTAANQGKARPPSGQPPPGVKEALTGTPTTPTPDSPPTTPPADASAPATTTPPSQPPAADRAPGVPPRQGLPTDPTTSAPPVGTRSLPSDPAPAGTRSLPSDQPPTAHTPEARAAASGVPLGPTAEETAVANTALAGARGTATTAVEAEQQALAALKEVKADPVAGGAGTMHDIVNKKIADLIDELDRLPEPGAKESAGRFKVLQKAMQDEDLIATVIGRVQAEIEVLEAAPTPDEVKLGLTRQERAIARLAGYREGMTLTPTTKFEEDFYANWVLDEPVIVDKAFAEDKHGKMIHATHDLIVAAAFEREGTALTGFQWRQSLKNPALSPHAQELQHTIWEEMFDSQTIEKNLSGDYVGSLNRPEMLNPIMDKILGGLQKP